MGFDADMRKVQERFKRWGDSNVVTIEAFSAVEGMINYYGGERERLFDSMQNELKRDRDGQGNWDNLCDKALDMLDRTNSSISGKIPNGFSGLGMSDFYEGEKANWQQCKNTKICSIAEGIYLCGQSNTEIFRKFEEDLKKSREDSKIIEELGRSVYGNMADTMKEGGVQVAAVLAAAPVAAIPMIGRVVAPQIRKGVQSMLGGAGTIRDLARKKAIARKILLDNKELQNKAKQQIGTDAIEVLRGKARDVINSWKNSRGDYNAEDWAQFGRPCLELMETKAVQAIERAKAMVYTMEPLYNESLTKAFITIFSDADTLAKLDEAFSNQVMKVMDDLAKEAAVMTTLRDNSEVRSANQEMKAIMDEVLKALQELKAALRDQYEMLKT